MDRNNNGMPAESINCDITDGKLRAIRHGEKDVQGSVTATYHHYQ